MLYLTGKSIDASFGQILKVSLSLPVSCLRASAFYCMMFTNKIELS